MQIKILDTAVEICMDGQAPVTLTGLTAAAAIMLVLAEHPVTPERLRETLWGEDGEQRSGSLRNRMSELRSIVGDRLVKTAKGYALTLDRKDYVDVRAFRALAVTAEQRAEQDPFMSAHLYKYVLGLWSDQPLEGLPTTPLFERIRTRLLDQRLNVMEARAEIDLRCGRAQEVVEYLSDAVAASPRREQLRRLLMWALYLTGRGGDALPLYETYQQELAEIGAEPSEYVRDMYERIRRGDPLLLHLTPVPKPATDQLVIAAGADPDQTSPLRLTNYLLGGEFNTWYDRALAEIMLTVVPEVTDLAIHSEVWAYRATRWGAEHGVRQFMDIGAGLHVHSPYSVHAALRLTAPGAKVVYTHPDAAMVNYCRSQQSATDANVRYVNAWMEAAPEVFLALPEITEHLDLSAPVMYFLREDEANYTPNIKAKVAALKSVMAPGSYLVMTRALDSMSDLVAQQLMAVLGGLAHPLVPSSLADAVELFDGLELLVGVDDTFRLLTDPGDRQPGQFRAVGGIGRKPDAKK